MEKESCYTLILNQSPAHPIFKSTIGLAEPTWLSALCKEIWFFIIETLEAIQFNSLLANEKSVTDENKGSKKKKKKLANCN
jgi:hypothetical protein